MAYATTAKVLRKPSKSSPEIKDRKHKELLLLLSQKIGIVSVEILRGRFAITSLEAAKAAEAERTKEQWRRKYCHSVTGTISRKLLLISLNFRDFRVGSAATTKASTKKKKRVKEISEISTTSFC